MEIKRMNNVGRGSPRTKRAAGPSLQTAEGLYDSCWKFGDGKWDLPRGPAGFSLQDAVDDTGWVFG